MRQSLCTTKLHVRKRDSLGFTEVQVERIDAETPCASASGCSEQRCLMLHDVYLTSLRGVVFLERSALLSLIVLILQLPTPILLMSGRPSPHSQMTKFLGFYPSLDKLQLVEVFGTVKGRSKTALPWSQQLTLSDGAGYSFQVTFKVVSDDNLRREAMANARSFLCRCLKI